MTRLRAIAFDAIGTCLSLEPLRAQLMGLALPASDLELWFARSLRDGMACECAGRFVPFKSILAAQLRSLLASRRLGGAEPRVAAVLESFATLPVHPDVWAAFQRVRSAGLKLAVLTNGNARSTREAFARAGLSPDEIISIDEVRHFKPAREVYLHAAKRLSVRPRQLSLVAAHAWDVQGARQAGLRTAFVLRNEAPSEALLEADASAGTLSQALERLGVSPTPRKRGMRWAAAIATAGFGALAWRRALA